MNTEPSQDDATAVADAMESALSVPDATPETGDGNPPPHNGTLKGNAAPLVTVEAPGDIIITVHGKRFPLPSQSTGWDIPATLRQRSLAALWSMIVSGSTDNTTRIRAIEALVRIDQQSLAADRQDDWRAVQSSNSNRSNVRIIAELARNKSAAKSLPKPPKIKKH